VVQRRIRLDVDAAADGALEVAQHALFFTLERLGDFED